MRRAKNRVGLNQDGADRAIDQPTAALKSYQTPSLVRYGALKELTKGGSEPMMEGAPGSNHANREP